MTMQHPTHPDDERLAALAGDDPEVASDAALRAHVDACDRCGPMVRELASLQAALSELPDLVPSRPLQLLPPVPAAASTTRGGWLRRLAAPAMAAGFVLVIVGAVGSAGLNFGMAGAAPTQAELGGAVTDRTDAESDGPAAPSSAEGAGAPSAAEVPAAEGSGEDSAGRSPEATRRSLTSGGTDFSGQSQSIAPGQPEAAPPAEGGGTSGLFESGDPRLPWLVMLGLGVGLLLAGIYLRFALQPRAG